jgi:hypothetical protein
MSVTTDALGISSPSLFVGQTLVSDQGALDYYLDHDEVLWQAPVSAALLALYYAVISVALASLTDRRIVGAISLLGLALVTSSVAAVFVSASDGESSMGALVNLLALPLYLRDLVVLGHIHRSEDLSGVAGGGALAVLLYAMITALAFTLLFWRYREVEL